MAALSQNWRQNASWLQEGFVEYFKAGKAGEGLNNSTAWLGRGEGRASPLRPRQPRSTATGEAEKKEILAVSPTHAAADLTTAAIRDRLKTEGDLGEERTCPAGSRTFDRRGKADSHKGYAAGDVLQFSCSRVLQA